MKNWDVGENENIEDIWYISERSISIDRELDLIYNENIYKIIRICYWESGRMEWNEDLI